MKKLSAFILGSALALSGLFLSITPASATSCGPGLQETIGWSNIPDGTCVPLDWTDSPKPDDPLGIYPYLQIDCTAIVGTESTVYVPESTPFVDFTQSRDGNIITVVSTTKPAGAQQVWTFDVTPDSCLYGEPEPAVVVPEVTPEVYPAPPVQPNTVAGVVPAPVEPSPVAPAIQEAAPVQAAPDKVLANTGTKEETFLWAVLILSAGIATVALSRKRKLTA